MRSDLKKHPFHYSVLVVFMLIHAVAFFALPQLLAYRHVLVISAVFWYLLWATIHHYLLDDLDVTLVLEYVLIGVICIALVWTVY